MYSELLRKIVGERREAFRAATDLQLQILLQENRNKMGAPSARPVDTRGGRPDAAAELALQLEYDLVLLELCRARGIASDPDRFGRPLLERRRLERALAIAPSESS